MARIPRSLSVAANHSVHKIWQGHNREWNLETSGQKAKYLTIMNEDIESEQFQSAAALRAVTVMSNHTHEVFYVEKPAMFSNHMRRHHSRYGAYFNRLMSRCGKVAQDRPKTCLIADDYHEMRAVFYVHANPVRAKIVKDANHYRWSTHKLYAFGKREDWMRNIRLPQWYLKLGRTVSERQKKYRRLFARYLREHGRKRQAFLRKLFFGPDLWMDRQQQKVTDWRAFNLPP